MLIYIDTNIYLDLIENRTDRLRPLGEFAFQLLKRTLACEFEVVVSDVVINEIDYNYRFKEFLYWMNQLKNSQKCVKIPSVAEDVTEAKVLSKRLNISFNDCLHAVLAKKSGACYLVTRNMKDFIPLSNLVKSVFPENL